MGCSLSRGGLHRGHVELRGDVREVRGQIVERREDRDEVVQLLDQSAIDARSVSALVAAAAYAGYAEVFSRG